MARIADASRTALLTFGRLASLRDQFIRQSCTRLDIAPNPILRPLNPVLESGNPQFLVLDTHNKFVTGINPESGSKRRGNHDSPVFVHAHTHFIHDASLLQSQFYHEWQLFPYMTLGSTRNPLPLDSLSGFCRRISVGAQCPQCPGIMPHSITSVIPITMRLVPHAITFHRREFLCSPIRSLRLISISIRMITTGSRTPFNTCERMAKLINCESGNSNTVAAPHTISSV